MVDLYSLVGPLLRCLDPENAHGLAITALKFGLVPTGEVFEDDQLRTNVWGREFPNPIGLAAGFDKNAEVPNQMLKLGFGFTEIGSVTPRPQAGNPRPRLFRLPEDRGVINRMGFNNDGNEAVKSRLKVSQALSQGIVGVNLGKNKETEEALDDYKLGVEALAPFADYLVINVSSPNTPGLRALQGRDQLGALLSGVRQTLEKIKNHKVSKIPLLLKVAPDLTDQDKQDIAEVAISQNIDGLIVSNTTIERPETLKNRNRNEIGGLSGQPLFEPSTQVLRDFYRLTEGKLPLVGVGGISNGEQAYAKIRAGASLVQLYSALVYSGPGLVNQIKRELVSLLKRDGFSSISEAVGADFRK